MNGLVAVPLIVVLILLVSRTRVMGAFTASKPIIILGWMTTALMAAAGIAMFLPGNWGGARFSRNRIGQSTGAAGGGCGSDKAGHRNAGAVLSVAE